MLFRLLGYEIFLTRSNSMCDLKLPWLYYCYHDNVMYIQVFGLKLTFNRRGLKKCGTKY
jgi:hypothetical protein